MQFRGIIDPEAPRRVLAALGLDEESRSAEGFSGGMKQKLRIAQALIHTPRLLLLDEPTTGLETHGADLGARTWTMIEADSN